METVRAFYEYPPSHANMPARDYGGSVTPAKARRSWGDLLKFRSRPKERQLSPAGGSLTQPPLPAPVTHNYMAEYRQKYGGYSGTVGRTSYQALRVVHGISSPPGLTSPSPLNSHATKTTMSSVRYTDWFGSVAGRRPPIRPPLPAFPGAPPPSLHAPEKSAAWDHYVTLDPVYEAPRVVPVQLYTNVCVCPEQLLNTRSKKKKKCKKCGRKVATVRHATAGMVAKVRPAISPNLYQPPTARTPTATPRAWGWQVLEEQVYERYEVQARRNLIPPAHTHSEEESPTTTPETIRSVKSTRSTKSGRSNDSSTTITRDALEPARPAPPPPRMLPSVPDDQNIVTNSFSAKETSSSGEIGDKRNSILTENPTAYQLLSSFGPLPDSHHSSDPDELSDNAVDTSWDTTPTKNSHTGTVITVGSSSPQGENPSWIVADKEAVNKIKIYTNPDNSVYNSGVNNSKGKFEKDLPSGSCNEITGTDITLSSKNSNNALSNKKINSSSVQSPSSSFSVPLCNGKHSSSPISKVASRIKSNSTKKSQNSVINSASHERKNGLKNSNGSVIINGNKKNLLQDVKHVSMSSQGSQVGVSSTTNGPRLEVKKLREASELQQGGNTVRIAGQRMLVLTPGALPPEPRSGFSSGEDENDVSVEDDTSDYPLSSPSRGSDSDTLPEEEDLPLDSSNLSYSYSAPNLDSAISSLSSSAFSYEGSAAVSDRWAAARDIIYEEEETGDADNLTNKDEIEENYGNSSSLGDEEQSVSSSSASSPLRPEGLHPTLSELLKVKSILKKPPSVDTSSETDSDFYLPTLEFKQNQRKKKQVQFRASHDVTVIEDAGESKGRKVSSARSSQKEQEKENWKNNYNLFSELQDIYARSNMAKVYKPQNMDSFVSSKNEKSEENVHGECEDDQSTETNISESYEQPLHEIKEEAGENGQLEPEVPPLDSINSALLESNEKERWSADREQENCNGGADSHQWSRLHCSLSEHQTSGESLPDLQDAANHHFSHHHKYPVNTTANTSSSSVPTRQAPPPPRSRTMSPTRPSVPPPPPPTVRPTAACVSPPRSSPRERPLPSPPPPLPTRPPPESPPPSPPPPLPTSPPPPLEDTERITIVNFSAQDSSPSQNPTFHSFKASAMSLYPPTKFISSPHPGSSTEVTHSKDELREVLPPVGHIPMFGAGEETRTATIRNRGAGHARPSFLGAFVAGVSPNTTTQSSPPQAPRRRNRNHSQSPEARAGTTRNSRHKLEGHSSQMSFQKGVREEDPYEQITDHIYEELLSRSPPISSPFSSHCSPTQDSAQLKSPIPGKSIFEGASKDEILEYLQDARRRVANSVDEDEDREQDLVGDPLEAEVDLEDDEEEDQLGVDPPEDQFTVLTSRNRGNRSSNMSSNSDSSENSGLLRSDKERLVCGEVERTDSGVGSETSKPSMLLRHGKQGIAVIDGATAVREGGDLPLCDDCDSPVDTRVTNSGVVYAPLVCRRCSRRRGERKEILTEIMETEIKYGQDLRVMIDQFYRPILVAGLLSQEQLKGIFLNVEDLQEHNRVFSLQLRDALEIALDQGDEDLLTVNVARLFLQAAPMLHAFETYCVRQGSASLLLQTLEKERELLRIFLKVSQMENTLLRRMNLHSFLMVPVQRVTKYPLLLARLYKTTPPTHASREDCRRAKEKIELHLQHMNNETKEVSPTKLWRRISMSVGSGTPMKRSSQSQNFSMNLKLRKLALQVLDWSPEEATVVREGRLFCLAPDSNNWTRRGRSLKMMTVHVLLVTLGMPRALFEEEVAEDGLVMSRNLGIKDAAMLAFKDLKVSKAALIRQEPWHLSRCVVAWEGEGETECFEVSDLNSKDTFIFKGSDAASTESWFRYIQFHALSVGTWKRRRPALANIMINGMGRC